MFVYISTFKKKKDKHQTSGIEIFKKFKSYHKKKKKPTVKFSKYDYRDLGHY